MNRASRLLQGEVDGQYRLHEALEPLYDLYRYIVIDTPPTLDALTVNSLIAATHVLIPVELAAFSFDGLQGVLDTIQRVKKRQNPDLKVLGILPSRCNFQRAEQREIYEYLEKEYADCYCRLWQNVRMSPMPTARVWISSVFVRRAPGRTWRDPVPRPRNLPQWPMRCEKDFREITHPRVRYL